MEEDECKKKKNWIEKEKGVEKNSQKMMRSIKHKSIRTRGEVEYGKMTDKWTDKEACRRNCERRIMQS